MSAESLNEDNIDVTELEELIRNMLPKGLQDTVEGVRACKMRAGWRAVDRYLEEKHLREQIQDPLFYGECF